MTTARQVVRSSNLILATLTAALILSYADRYLLAVLVEPIRQEMELSDTMVGFLLGFAFSAFYALIGLPVSRLADRGWHRGVVAASILFWSLTTLLTGLAKTPWQMALARFGTGAGEAGVYPAAQAILSELFPPPHRTVALSIFSAGGSIGLLLAFAIGGWLSAQIGWRATFLAMAVPGLILAPIAWMVIPKQRSEEGAPTIRMPLRKTLERYRTEPALQFLLIAQIALVILLFGQAQWLPSFFERQFDHDRAFVGLELGLIQGLANIAGVIGGGILSDRMWRRRGARGPIPMAMSAIGVGLVAAIALYSSPDILSAYGWLAIAAFAFALPSGTIAAHLQFLARSAERASAAAINLIGAALVGLGAGPLAIGILSDMLLPVSGSASLGQALSISVAFSALCCIAALFLLGRATPRCPDDGQA